jgi:DNA-3-methyladenine glycosylase II
MPQVEIAAQGPYDLALSLKVAASFAPQPEGEPSVLRMAVRAGDTPVLMQVRQVQKDPPRLQVVGSSSGTLDRLREVAAWVLFAELDLEPFYALLRAHPRLAPLTVRLRGLKPMRPASLFQMAVIAITEQQISLAAAYHIRSRMIERFGDRVEDLWAFPTPERLAQAPMEELLACGLSHGKAKYIHDLALKIVEGSLDLDVLKQMPDDEAHSWIVRLRGFGRWSAEYILVRGLGRPDCVPADDLGIRSVAGAALGDGSRMTAEEVREALQPFAPYRGLAAFYLLAASRARTP